MIGRAFAAKAQGRTATRSLRDIYLRKDIDVVSGSCK